MKVKCDHRSNFFQFKQLERRSLKKIRASTVNWKIYCDDHPSLSSTTAAQIWIISYKLHGRPFVKWERKISFSMLQLGINRKRWQNQNWHEWSWENAEAKRYLFKVLLIFLRLPVLRSPFQMLLPSSVSSLFYCCVMPWVHVCQFNVLQDFEL